MNPKPILIISDAPSCTSGLGRITRDLATRIALDMTAEFRVATLGYGGSGSRSLPFQQYHIAGMKDFVIPDLPIVVRDWAGDEECILLCVWDATRLLWLTPAACPIPALAEWLKTAPVKKWLYGAIDAEGPFGRLSYLQSEAYKGFDRVLNYSKWSAGITGYPDYLPHGIDCTKFTLHDRTEAKWQFLKKGFAGLCLDSLLVGIVATNQSRKDWALGIQTCRELLDRGHDVRVWAHTDSLNRYWDFPALVTDYGLQGRVVITTSNFSDEQMSEMYSACDVTLGIGLGEGFGYPIFESLASGTPVVHGDYGGAAEHLPLAMLISSIGERYEGAYCCKRPIFHSHAWADRVEVLNNFGMLSELPAYLDWTQNWPKWREWLKKGLGGEHDCVRGMAGVPER